jgi:hypothetical protein
VNECVTGFQCRRTRSDFADTAVTARVLFHLLSDPGFGPCFIESPGAHGCK